jgi:hypothetical protein
MPAGFVVVAPRIYLIFLGVILLAVLVAMILKRGDTKRKITALVIVLVVLGGVALMFYRPTVVSVGERGITVKRFLARTVPWTDVIEAIRIADLSTSEYRPTRRVVGVSLGSYRVGTFRLEDGGRAQAVMEQTREALLIITQKERYLFAIKDNDSLVEAVGRFVEVTEQ